MYNTAFFGTSDKSRPILDSLYTNTNLTLCVTKTDRIVGRKKEIKPTVVKEWAKEKNIELLEIDKMDSETRQNIISKLKEHKIDVGVVADFSYMIHQEIISTPPKGLINIHFSKLPKYRGASPVQHTILNGEKVTAVTFMLMSKGMDEGDILKQFEIQLTGSENSAQLYEKMFQIAGENLPKVIDEYFSGKIQPQPQNHSLATYCFSKTNPKSTLIDKEDAKIDWHKPHIQIERLIRAFNPWPVAWSTLQDIDLANIFGNKKLKQNKDSTLKVKIYEARINENGKLSPTKLQVQGGNILSTKEFLNGYFE